MFFKKIIFFLLIVVVNFSFAQKRKKKTDTIYVYEKVVVYDTIYLEKPFKSKFKDIYLTLLSVQEKEIKDVLKEKLKNKRFNQKIRKQLANRLEYGIEAGLGLKNSNWARELSSDKQQFGENIGIWVSRNIADPRFSLMLSANVYHWNSTFDLDGTQEETYLNGYYFTKDNQPLLFQRFNNKHVEYALQLKFFYDWKNIRPFVGFLANRTDYKMQFLVPENKILNKLEDFKTTQINFGFSFGFQYRVLRKVLISFDYQQYNLNNVSVKNSSFDFDIFKTNNTFAERKINLGISYVISK
ncbi:hypothetical protein ACM39_00185 [Chryseobacterium sp. FH2]|uniref:outer membrane beta-barrel protein n=1 Tax=Chryseobacterium sp. FH2 TaxID=1674291 RepID=UPI00065B08CB|nr:outer membrane beta-barrel protein [Chryseobacterium sp. FH2]KMQ69524.1 hypothetical protein ACM39_00185 [Chryseobacterium sp. FH2]